MKKLIPILLLGALSVIAAEYSLKKDQFISHVLWDNQHVDFKWDLKKIAAILRHNGLTWDSAKRLPIGYTFEVPDADTSRTVASAETNSSASSAGASSGGGTLSADLFVPQKEALTELKLGVNAGVFHEELGLINGNKKFIYSDMSQQIGMTFESDKEKSTFYSASLKLQNHVYEADSRYGILKDIQKVTHSLKVGYTYRKYHDWKVRGFVENENRLFFNIKPDNSAEMQVGNSTNLGLAAEWSPLYVAASLWGVGAHMAGKALSNEFKRNDEYRFYVFAELYEAGVRADLGYAFTDLEINSESVRNRQVELNLNYFFL